MGLSEYNRKRDFERTKEPPGDTPRKRAAGAPLEFVIQKHAATRLHYDFRLELDDVLKSWSVPKGPSLDPKVKRLAMHVEDHPMDYATFEGLIPKGQYGGGTVLLWDRGTWEPIGDPHQGYAAGNLKFLLKGEKLHGGFALVRIGGRKPRPGADDRAWLLVKERDAEAREGAAAEPTELRPESVSTGRTLEEVAGDRSSIWHSKTAHLDLAGVDGARPAPLPAKLRPPRAADKAAPPGGDGWLHEVALDGRRVLARVAEGKVDLFSEAGTRLPAATARPLQPIADAVRMLPAHTLVVDGVVAPLTEDGKTLGYFLHDLPYLDGHDLARTPLERRKQLLEELIRRAPERGRIRALEHIASDGLAFRQEAARLGIARMVSRRADSPYGAKAGWIRAATAGAANKPKPARRRAKSTSRA